MNTLNHLASGAGIAIATQNPWAAIPVSVVSHFVLDTVPHFGYNGVGGYGEALNHKLSYVSLIYDGIGIVLLFILLRNQPWYVFVSGIAAASPDAMWMYRYFWYERKGLVPPGWKIVKFHQRIQWFEKPIGLVIEVVFSIILLAFIWSQV